MPWYRCLEIPAIVLCAGGAIAALTVAIVAVVSGYRETRPLRAGPRRSEPANNADLTDEAKARMAAHWKGWRDRIAPYASDISLLANPLRRDAIEIVKESANWGRLGVQYAMIGNGGALAALPYLLSQTAPLYKLAIHDAVWSAVWFAIGLISAALCCLVAYSDFQVTATMYWANQGIEVRLANQRHFETNDQIPVDAHHQMLGVLQSVAIKTSLCGVALAVIAWFALAWGAFRLIISMAP
jgi:hypothetical protein